MRLAIVCAGTALLLLAAPAALADTLHSATFASGLVTIDTTNASSVDLGSDTTVARGAAFDLDGTLFATVNSGRFLGTFDPTTGAVSVIGPLVSTGVLDAIDVDASGRLIGITTSGFVYRIDKATGAPTLLSTLALTSIQDVSYAPDGTLWAVTLNRLYVIDPDTGASQLKGTIGGARTGNVFGISFDGTGRLWATSTTSNAPLYEIDLTTLAARLVGLTGVDFPRGCDIYVPTPEEPPPPPDADGDGVPDEDDAFPNSDLRESVFVGDLDTGVENVFFPDGSTIADLVIACAEDVRNAGEFVDRVAHLLIALREDGLITGAEQGSIQRAAARFRD